MDFKILFHDLTFSYHTKTNYSYCIQHLYFSIFSTFFPRFFDAVQPLSSGVTWLIIGLATLPRLFIFPSFAVT